MIPSDREKGYFPSIPLWKRRKIILLPQEREGGRNMVEKVFDYKSGLRDLKDRLFCGTDFCWSI